jgi:fatty acid desaturase
MFIIYDSYYQMIKAIKMSKKRKVIHILGRLLTFAVTFGWPFVFTSFPLYKQIIWSIVPQTIWSFIYSFFASLNHHHEQNLNKFDKDYFKHQVTTAHNFCVDSPFWYYLSTGLTLQIEHHLFPGFNHCHLRKIQPIVQEVCRKHNVPYHVSATVSEAIRNYRDNLKKMGESKQD